MARFVGGDFREDRPKLVVLGDGEARGRAAGRAIYEQYIKRDRSDPMYPRGLGEYVTLGEGYRFPVPQEPYLFRIVTLPSEVPDIMHSRIGSLYSRRVVDGIEAIESGAHQFFPVDVEMPDGSPVSKPFWLLNNCNRIDAIVLDQSRCMYEKWPNRERWPLFSRYGEIVGGQPILALSKAKISGLAIWFDYKLMRGFASNEFAAFLDGHGIKGWEKSDDFTYRSTILEV